MAMKLFEAMKAKQAKEETEKDILKKEYGYKPGWKGDLEMAGSTVKTLLTGGTPTSPKRK